MMHQVPTETIKTEPIDLFNFGIETSELQEFHSDKDKQSAIKLSSATLNDDDKIEKQLKKNKINEFLKENKVNDIKNNISASGISDDGERALIHQLGYLNIKENHNNQIENFILSFNHKPEKAINEYISNGFIASNDAQHIASYIIKIQGLDKTKLGEYFGKNDTQVLKVLHAYCSKLDFRGKEFDLALRNLLSQFRLPGEAQQIQRIIWEFSLSFHEANQDTIDNADELHPLAYSIIMLSTDAHNPKQVNKMSCDDFVRNTGRACPSIPKDYLCNIYSRIVAEKFETQVSYMEQLYARLQDLSPANIADTFAFNKELMKGDVFLKVCRRTRQFVQRKVSLSQDQKRILWVSDPMTGPNEEPRFVMMDDVIELTLGIGSETMSKVPKAFDPLCFTITTKHRTLDLKAKTSKERAKWLNYLRAILIGKRQNEKRRMESAFEESNSRVQIQDIWNIEIFPSWDQHWNYKEKKPQAIGYIRRGFNALCCCCRNSNRYELYSRLLNIKEGSSLLHVLWKNGLPHKFRNTLWPLVIGNNLALTAAVILDCQNRLRPVPDFREACTDQRVLKTAELLLTLRPDLPAIPDVLKITQLFVSVFHNQQISAELPCLSALANALHNSHFLPFYNGDKTEIGWRVDLFEQLLRINVPKVLEHFKGLGIETRMYMIGWFLSVFCDCFRREELLRIWDNFLLEGELYLFQVGIALIKYYEIELKMCTFKQGLKLIRFPKEISSVYFFYILENTIDVRLQHYTEYIQKRKHAIIKTRVQEIPLQS